jgi:malonyl-CoA O-methyltransferase
MNSAAQFSALRSSDVRRRFDQAAEEFEEFDFVHAVTRDGLLARLEPMVMEAKTVVDLGCATGSACKPLAKRFRRAHIIALDLSASMLQQVRLKQSWFKKYSLLHANAKAIPLADQSVDVVFANQLLPWIDDSATVFTEVARVLRENGLFLFAGLGPDSLSELRRAWRSADAGVHVNRFPDMHDLGDAAVRAGLTDPVLDVDRLSVTYQDAGALFRDLTGCGARNCLANRSNALSGRARFDTMAAALEQHRKDGPIGLDLELVYGHCWGAGPRAHDGEVRIDPGRIGHRIQRFEK